MALVNSINLPEYINLANCASCTLGFSGGFGNIVPGLSVTKDKVIYAFVGEAPGQEEINSRIPFTNNAGKLLRFVLENKGKLSKSYFTNACLCHSRNNTPPTIREITCCHNRLFHELRSIDPEIIFAIGATALKSLVPTVKVTSRAKDFIGKVYHVEIVNKIYPVVFIHHPAYVIHNSAFMPLWEVLIDMQELAARELLRIPKPKSCHIVTTIEDAKAILTLFNKNIICLDLETSSLNPRTCELLCIALAYKINNQYHAIILYGKELLNLPAFAPILQYLITNNRIVGQNLAFDSMVLMHKYGETFFIAPYIDTLIAAQAVYPRTKGHDLETLLLVHLGYSNYKGKFRDEHNSQYDTANINDLATYAAADACCTLELASLYTAKIMQQDHFTACNIMRMTHETVQHTEYRGIRVDMDFIAELKTQLTNECIELAKQIETITRGKVKNARSSQQVGNYLYEDLKLKPLRKTAKGNNSTDSDTIETYAIDNEEINLIKQYRSKMNIIADHINGTLKYAYSCKQGYYILHPKYKVDVAVTGRLASSEPNTQNYPKLCRNMFIPRDDTVFVEADYKQLEVRVGLVLANDADSLAMAQSSTSIHVQVTTRIYGSIYTKDQYRLCKSVVFEIMYGGDEPKVIAGKLNISIIEAKDLIKLVHSVMPGYLQWRASIRAAVKRGLPPYVTPFGRHRDFPIINATNLKSVMNECINFPVQSTASDVCQYNTYYALKSMGWIAVNTTHDSILVELPTQSWQEKAIQLKNFLEQPITLLGHTISFPVDLSAGIKWGELKNF